MSLAEFIALVGGVLMQIGLLFANNEKDPLAFIKKDKATLVASPTSYDLPLLFGGIVLLTSILLNQFSFGSTYFRWVDDRFTFVIAAIFAFVLFLALGGDQLLPRVNEQQMLGIHLVVGINFLLTSDAVLPSWGYALLVIPTIALIFQGIWPRPLPLIQRAFFYLWYLVTLVALAFQNGGSEYFEMIEMSMPEIFIFGSLLIFLGVHLLVAMHFVLIISSLILPRNRPLLKIIMPRLVHEEQLSLPMLLLMLAVAGGVLYLNYTGNLEIEQTLVNVFVLALRQLPKNFSALWTEKAT